MNASTPSKRPTRARLARLSVPLAAAIGTVLLLLPAAASGSPAGSGKTAQIYPQRVVLTDSKVGHWATVLRPVTAHRLPNAESPPITTLRMVTGDGTENIVLILARMQLAPKNIWYKVRLAILPNNSTGWVPQAALGNIYTVHTHLYVDRKTFTATLKRDGRTVFTTRVGVGSSDLGITPAGQFYIRDKLRQLKGDPLYGPLAFGTSARSATYTDWPGGGFIGVHGTDQPDIIPGAVSHGCIRMKNGAILKLSRLMQVGTPLTVT